MILFAFTGLALALGASSYFAIGAAIVADAALVAASAYSAYSSAQMSRANAKTAAQQQKLQAAANDMQARDLERQAAAEQQKAGIAQMQAEQEAEKRSRIMANDIGSAYANYAGNGLLVDGGDGDTFGRVLTTTVAEAEQDISTIRDNGKMSVWDYKSNAQSLLVSGQTAKISGVSSLIGAAASKKNAKYYNQASYLGAATGGISAAASAVSTGFAGASYAKK